MASQSTPSSSPRPLSRASQRWVSRSLPGCARRPTISPAAAARSAPLTPSSSSSGINPTCSRAQSPTCSTPTLRGRARAIESGWIVTLSAGSSDAPPDAPPTPRASSRAAMRCASVSGCPRIGRTHWPLQEPRVIWQAANQSLKLNLLFQISVHVSIKVVFAVFPQYGGGESAEAQVTLQIEVAVAVQLEPRQRRQLRPEHPARQQIHSLPAQAPSAAAGQQKALASGFDSAMRFVEQFRNPLDFIDDHQWFRHQRMQ